MLSHLLYTIAFSWSIFENILISLTRTLGKLKDFSKRVRTVKTACSEKKSFQPFSLLLYVLSKNLLNLKIMSIIIYIV